ncbi:peptidyl-tRNA hydrolase II [Dichomitus squalens]|uniref:peptidyl-tRNA hydrolase n=1 Tax=Dichomitus squalens TaxID=114155 RepID=A0A4Q9N382_9APHY|nr:peptidyl-tRNA hydrolase II [Dichomitus squalens]
MSSLSTTQSVVFAVALATSLSAGFALGAWATYRERHAAEPRAPSATKPEPSKNAREDSDEEVEEEEADGDLSAVKPEFLEPCKMVLVVRTDLGMTTGKIAAHHATLACYKALQKTNPALLKHWERTGQAKIALKATSEDELLELEAIAKSLNLAARSILDASVTDTCALCPVELVNKVTGKLRLL